MIEGKGEDRDDKLAFTGSQNVTPGETDVLVKMYLDHVVMLRHFESLRSSHLYIIIVMVGILFGLFSDDLSQTNREQMAWFFWAILFIGFFGVVTGQKLREREWKYISRVQTFRQKLDALFPTIEIEALTSRADVKHAREFPITHRIPLGWVWGSIHGLIGLVGLFGVLREYNVIGPISGYARFLLEFF